MVAAVNGSAWGMITRYGIWTRKSFKELEFKWSSLSIRELTSPNTKLWFARKPGQGETQAQDTGAGGLPELPSANDDALLRTPTQCRSVPRLHSRLQTSRTALSEAQPGGPVPTPTTASSRVPNTPGRSGPRDAEPRKHSSEL